MGRYVKTVGLLIFVSSIVSCITAGTVSIETNKDPSAMKILEKVYVLIDVGSSKISIPPKDPNAPGAQTVYVPVGEYLKGEIEKSLVARAVEAKVVRIGGLELNTDIKKDIADYGATNALTIKLDNAEIVQDLLGSGSFVVSVNDNQSEKAIWKSRIAVIGGTFQWMGRTARRAVDSRDVDNIIAKMMAAMTTDGLLKKTAVPSGT